MVEIFEICPKMHAFLPPNVHKNLHNLPHVLDIYLHLNNAEDYANFCGLLRKAELYAPLNSTIDVTLTLSHPNHGCSKTH